MEFWKSYCLIDDYFDRKEKLKELPFFKELEKYLKDHKDCEILCYLIRSEFQSYIDDILEISNVSANYKAKD